jgi:hypothetical protein
MAFYFLSWANHSFDMDYNIIGKSLQAASSCGEPASVDNSAPGREGKQVPLLVFVDSLVLLDILQRWGNVSFNPLHKR